MARNYWGAIAPRPPMARPLVHSISLIALVVVIIFGSGGSNFDQCKFVLFKVRYFWDSVPHYLDSLKLLNVANDSRISERLEPDFRFLGQSSSFSAEELCIVVIDGVTSFLRLRRMSRNQYGCRSINEQTTILW